MKIYFLDRVHNAVGKGILTSMIGLLFWTMGTFAAPNPPTAEDPKIAISPVVRSMQQLGGTGAINTSGSGTWKASVSSSWIHLAATSGNAGYAVGYTVDANSEVEQRIGYVYVSGYVHTLTQDGIGATLGKSSANFEWSGGSGSVSVTAPSGKTWHAKSNVSWISVASSTGTGASTLKYTVSKFEEVSTRSGTLTIADRTFTVNQTGRRMTLATSGVDSDYLADTVKIKINALASTEWSVSKNVDWITITDAGNGHGGDTVEIKLAENPSYNSRSGKVTIGTETFTVNQQGRDSLVFRIGKTEASYNENGISLERVTVTATPDLGWTAKSGTDWIEVSSSAKSGSGDGSFTYKVKPNPTLYSRTSEITVTAASSTVPVKHLKISQKAAVATLTMSSYTFESAKESVKLGLATGSIVGWDVINTNSWLTIAGATKVGSCTLTLTAAQNTSVRPRSGVVRIAEHDFVVTQQGRGVKLTYEEKVFNTDGKTTGANAENIITVTTDSTVSWAAIASDPTWIIIYQGMSGTGNGTIKFVVAPYVGAGEIRKGTITVGDQTVYITQRPYELSIDPKGEWVDSNAGAGEIQVAMDINKVWEAISTEPWLIVIQKYDSGTGNGKVLFQFTENTTGRQRTGKIMIAGETYTLTQEARKTATIEAVVETRGGTVSGGGIYDIGTELTLTAVADAGYTFDCWLLPGGGTSKNLILKTTVASAGTYTARFVPAKLNLKVELACLKGVCLGWSNLVWATQYRVWRGTSSVRSQAKQIGTQNAGTKCTYMDESGTTGQQYWYWVEAVGGEEQTWSDAVAGTRAKGTFSITYENLRGTTQSNPTKYTEGGSVSFKAPSARVGYTFVGWEPRAITADTTGNITVYALWEQNTYAVQFNANGGEGVMSDETFTYGFWKYLSEKAFNRPAYNFSGWAKSATGSVVYQDVASVKNLTATQTGHVPLYAKWTRKTGEWEILYENLKGATHNNPGCYTEGAAVVFAKPSQVTGYTFANWTPSRITASDRGDVTVTANWTPNKYKVAYDANGGQGTLDSVDCTYDVSGKTAEGGFVRFGYTFAGWATKANGAVTYKPGQDFLNLTTTAGSLVKLYAVWETNRYQVVFNANGGSGKMNPQEFLYFEAQPLAANAFVKTGYGFTGWATNASQNVVFANQAIVSNLTATADGEVNLYAKWKTNAYTVKFNANGGTGTMANESMVYDSAKELTACTFTRIGYVFAGWATSASGSVTYTDKQSVKNLSSTANATVNLYAKWTANAYKIKFNANGGAGTMADEVMAYDSAKALTACAFTRTGYTFAGWATNASQNVVFADKTVVSNLTFAAGTIINLYAKWTANGYTIKFNANGGSGTMANESMVYDTAKTLTTCSFTRTGYTFMGWATSASGNVAYTNKQSVKNLSSTANATINLYAKWNANAYTIKFNANGGTGTMANESMGYDTAKTLTACAFKRAGYTFLGWATSASGSVTYTDKQSVKNISATANTMVNLYAKWKANTYTVKFNANGGKGTMSNQAFLYDVAQKLLPNRFTRSGCEFMGWATSATGEVAYTESEVVSNLTTTAEGIVNLYAVWDDSAMTWIEDGNFSADVANTYDGYIIDGVCNLIGIVQVKTTKQSIKTTTNKTTKEKIVTTNITATATVTDLNGKKWSYTKGIVTIKGDVSGLNCTTKGCPVSEFAVEFGKNGMKGAWGDYVIIGARNGMATKGDAMMAMLEQYKGKWSITIGTLRLQLDIQAKGSVKIAGNWENGVKVSASAQLVMGDGFAFVPLMVKSTKTSPALNVLLRIVAGGEVTLLSEGDLIAGGRTTAAIEIRDYLAMNPVKAGAAYVGRIAINELSYPAKFTQKGLPTGLKLDAVTGVVSGAPTKPGEYEVAFTATSALNSKSNDILIATIKVENYIDDLIPLKDYYGPYTPGVSYAVTIPSANGCTVSGAPTGMKWTANVIKAKDGTVTAPANSLYGIPTTPGKYTVYFNKSVNELNEKGKSVKVTHTATATFEVADYPKIAVLPSLTVAGSEPMPITEGDELTFFVGVNQTFAIGLGNTLEGVDTTVAAKGLPSGLKLVKKTIYVDPNASKKVVDHYEYVIEGVPTKASSSDKKTGAIVPSHVTLTASNKYKWQGEISFDVVVVALPSWASGTFEGGNTNGIVTLTITKEGKLSGKWMSEGLTWTLATTSYEVYSLEDDMFGTRVIAKSGKLVMTNEVWVSEKGVVAYALRDEPDANIMWEAWQNGWKMDPLKNLATKLKGKTVQIGEVMLTVGANGTVSAKGVFVTGFDEKKKKDIIYTASCSTVLIPMEESNMYKVYLYFPAKLGYFNGFSACEKILLSP